jgi:hypothetical protein
MGLDDILDFFTDGWDALIEGISYAFSFEWFGDIGEGFSTLWENIGNFSIIGLALGMLGAGMVYGLRSYMLDPFLKFMSPMEALFWGIATYIGCFIGGYLVGSYMENS